MANRATTHDIALGARLSNKTENVMVGRHIFLRIAFLLDIAKREIITNEEWCNRIREGLLAYWRIRPHSKIRGDIYKVIRKDYIPTASVAAMLSFI